MDPLKNDWTDEDEAAVQHPQAHNDLATRINLLEEAGVQVVTSVSPPTEPNVNTVWIDLSGMGTY